MSGYSNVPVCLVDDSILVVACICRLGKECGCPGRRATGIMFSAVIICSVVVLFFNPLKKYIISLNVFDLVLEFFLHVF